MTTSRKLCILVQSGRYFNYLEELTKAADIKGKEVKIHLLGTGVEFIESTDFHHLTHRAQITICSTSFEKRFTGRIPTVPKGVKFVRPGQITDILQWSDRCVVF